MANTAIDWRTPTLYASSSDNIESEGIGALTGIISGKTINELNEFPTIEFRYDAHDDLAPYLTHDRIVVADVGPNQRNQMFRVTEVDRHNADYIDVKGVHILGDLYYNAISPITMQNTDVIAALNAMKSSLADPMPLLKFQSDIETQFNVGWTLENQQNAQYALGGANGSLLQILKGEYRFDNWTITYNKAIGQDLGQTIEYGKNLITVDQTDAMTDVYTAIQPYAWLQPETPDGGQQPPKVLLTLPEKVIKVDAGSQFERLRIKTVDLSEYDVTDAASLRKVAEAYMSDNQFGIPNQSLKVNYAQMTDDLAFLETSNVGDRSTVYFPQAQVNTKGEVQHTEWDWLIHEYTDTEIGWRKPTGGSMLDRYKKDSQQQVDNVNDKVDEETENRKDADTEIKQDVTEQAQEWHTKWQSVNQIQQDIATLNRDVTDYINSGGKGIIQFLPNRDNPTSMRINSNAGGYFLLDDNGLGYFGSSGAKTAMDNRGNIVASVIAAGTSITSPNIIGGTITAASIVNGDFRTQDTYGNETHVSAQGITTAKFVQAPVFYLPGSSGVWIIQPSGSRLIAHSPVDGKDYVMGGPAW